jgi:hypothetical protein
MSDIYILPDPANVIFLALVFGSPGLRVGLIAGAVLWRARRIWGALIGAVIGFGLFLGGMWIYIVN